MSHLKISVLPPSKKVQQYVRRILITELDNEKSEILPIGPSGFSYFTYSRFPIKLVFSDKTLESDKQLYLAGQPENEQPYFDIKGPFFHIGLEMYPTAPAYFFGINGLVDGGVVLEEIDADLAQNFSSQYNNEQDPQKIAQGLEQIIFEKSQQIQPVPFIDQALDIIYKESGHIDISELVKRINISERHLRRTFKKIIGISPKQYCKVIQFNAVFETIQQGKEKELYDIALKHGYYDHAHFINDFKRLLGQSPKQFLNSGHAFLKSYMGAHSKYI